MKPVIAATVGCGMISEIYLKNLTTLFENIHVKYCCDLRAESAQKRAEQFQIGTATLEQILADEEIRLVIVLTPPPTHYGLIKQALLAGKHVYTEKVMSLTTREAKELCALADERKLYLGSAPDTFMGAGIQRAREVLGEDALGPVTGFDVYINRNMDVITSCYPFVRMAGGGILYDYGVYHLTALVHLLGNVREVCAVIENNKPVRTGKVEGTPDFGKTYEFPNEAQVTAILRMESGVVGTLTLNGESIGKDLCRFRLYGEKAVLELPDCNYFGGELTLINEKGERSAVENLLPYSENSRGIGPSEMMKAMREGRKNAANKEQALHVLSVMEAMVESSRTGRFTAVEK